MMKTPIREVRAEIKMNFMRFLSITLLFLMASMLYAGFFAVQPSFYKTIDDYRNEYQMSDMTLIKENGFTEKEYDQLKNNHAVESISGSHYADVIADTKNYFKGVRLQTMPEGVDKLWLLEGSLPEKANECVVLPAFLEDNKLDIGDNVEITNSKNKSLKYSELQITGTVQSPIYARYESIEGYDKSSVGMGYVYYAMYVPHEAFSDDITNQISIRLSGTEDVPLFTNEEFLLQETENLTETAPWISDVKVTGADDYTVVTSFIKDMERAGVYAKTLPNLFVIAALIICIIAIMRIINKDKKQIGIMKSMGYSDNIILRKYSFYGSLAYITGAIIGAALGIQIIPRFIYMSYEELYFLPELEIGWAPVRLLIFFLVIMLILNILIAITVFRFLRKSATSLLLDRPDDKESGNKDRPSGIPLSLWTVWTHIAFSGKRTLFTCISLIISIMLLINAFSLFGINKGIRDIQFEEIVLYDYVGEMSGESQTDKFVKELNDYLSIRKADFFSTREVHIKGWGNINMISADLNKLSKYISVRDVNSGKKVTAKDDSVIITALMAEKMGLDKGDILSFTVDGGNSSSQIELTIDAVMENYWDNYVIVTPGTYSKIMDSQNFVKKDIVDTEDFMVFAYAPSIFRLEVKHLKALLEENQEYFNFVIPTEEMQEMVMDTLRAVSFFGYLLIAFAVLIAMAALWNLIDIILSERRKEQYIYRSLGYPENHPWRLYLLEILGMALLSFLPAVLLGKQTFSWLISVIENDTTMLVRPEGPLIYVLSGAITVLLILVIMGYKRIRAFSPNVLRQQDI